MMRLLISIFMLIFVIVLAGCAMGIKRQGYDAGVFEAGGASSDCRVLIEKEASFPENEIEVLGKVDVYDAGFSIKCDEFTVLEILRKEACALGANLINITEDNSPDDWSTCYRVKAELLRTKISAPR